MQCLEPQQGFLGLDETEGVCYEKANAVILPFGLEASVSYGSGTALGPKAILKASQEVELFDEHFWCEPYKKIGIATIKEPVIQKPISEALNQLEAMVEMALSDNKFPFVLGGEHSITAGSIRPFLKRYPDLVILHFDAHADLRDGYQGEHYSHASAIRRCLDNPTVELVSIGIRNISASEIPFLEQNRHRITIFWAKDKAKWSINDIAGLVKDKPIYLTFDVDGFDASIMPATGTPEPGGLFWQEVIDIIEKASLSGHIVGADLNELAPVEHLHGCDFLSAKLVYKILSFAFAKKSNK